MIISQAKPKEELMDFIKDANNVLIAGCSLCASTCKVGGEEEIAALKTELEAAGKNVLGTLVLDPACNLLKTRKDMKVFKEQMPEVDAIVSLACGDGTQTLAKVVSKPVYPGNNTMFIGEIERVGQYEESCLACGDCELGWTAGICPITRCAKSLMNGPCGGAKNGKCEVNAENDCAWILIYNKLKDEGRLSNITENRPPKDFQKNVHPKRIELTR